MASANLIRDGSFFEIENLFSILKSSMTTPPGGNNQSKKTYAYVRAPKQQVTVVYNGVTRSYDAQAMMYHRDFYSIINDALQVTTFFPTGSASGQYDEALITLNWETSKTATFNINFTSNPIVVLDVIPNTDLENINLVITNVTTSSLSIETSATFSGSIRYRAIYAAAYPVTVARTTLSSAFTYQVSAGYVDLVSSNFFTASYASFGSPPTSAVFTPYDISGSLTANVALVASSSYGLTSSTGDLSSPITDRINFMFFN